MLENAIWIISYLSGMLFFIAALTLAWLLFRDVFTRFNYRKILFSIGILGLSGSFLFIDMANIKLYPTWTIFLVGACYILITIALSKKWWQYLLILSVTIPSLVPGRHTLFYLAFFAGSIVAYLAYNNFFCLLADRCSIKSASDVNESRIEWGIAFFLLAIVSSSYVMMALQSSLVPGLVYQSINIVAKLAISAIFIHYILHFGKFNRNERVVMPFFIFMIAIVISLNVLLSFWVKVVLLHQLEDVVGSDIHSVQMIAERTYPDGTLVEMIKNKDPKLNLLVDDIYAKTGVKSTFFLRDVRIASNPGGKSNKRPNGVKLVSNAVRSKVLVKGEEYKGEVSQGSTILIADYLPIRDVNGVVIGMVGTAKNIDHITSIEQQLIFFYGIVLIVTLMIVVMLLVILKMKPKTSN